MDTLDKERLKKVLSSVFALLSSVSDKPKHMWQAVNKLLDSVVVLEESPCPRRSSRTNFQILVLSLSFSSEVQVLENFRGLSRLM